MAPPKRAVFSLNYDTDADHIYHRIEDHTKEGQDKVKVVESTGPVTGSTKVELATKPFERIVDRTVQGVVQGTGKNLESSSGTLDYETHTSTRGSGSHTKSEPLATKKKTSIGGRHIARLYDTSDL